MDTESHAPETYLPKTLIPKSTSSSSSLPPTAPAESDAEATAENDYEDGEIPEEKGKGKATEGVKGSVASVKDSCSPSSLAAKHRLSASPDDEEADVEGVHKKRRTKSSDDPVFGGDGVQRLGNDGGVGMEKAGSGVRTVPVGVLEVGVKGAAAPAEGGIAVNPD